MFSNLNWYNIVVLLLLALFIFGDKLPQMISDGMRMLRNLRRMAQDATSDLSREFGTEVRLEDLHPKNFVRRHLLSEEDQQALVQPFRSVSEDLRRHTSDLQEEVRQTAEAMEPPRPRAAPPARSRPDPVAAGAAPSAASAASVEVPAEPTPREPAPRHASYDDIT